MTRPDTGPARPGTGAASRVKGARFCRVTVLTPRSRMDLALPTDLTVAELVPMLTELAGESGSRGGRGSAAARPEAWCLAAAAGAELPSPSTLAGLGVLDGDLLRLRRRAEAPPAPVFDDPVDAVAEEVPPSDGTAGAWGVSASHGRSGPLAVRPWDDRCRRIVGLAAGGLSLVLAAVLLAAARGPGVVANPVAAVIGALASVGALAAGMRSARVDPTTAALLVAGAVPLAAATGFTALPGTPAAGHLLLAAGLAAAAGAAGLASLDTPSPALVAAVLASGMCAMCALLATFGAGPPAGLAAGAAAVAVAMLPLLPRVSIRLAGLPPPVIPTTPDEMLAADAQWQLDSAEDIRYHSRLAHTYLAGLVAGAAVVAGVGAMRAADGGVSGAIFAAVVVAVLLLRSRAYATAMASAAPMAAGLVAGAVLASGLGRLGPGLLPLGGALGLLVAGAVAVALVRAGDRDEASPVLRKAVDIVEAILVVATFPLALWVLDLYRLVRGL